MTLRLRRPLTLVVPVVTSLALAGGAMAAVAPTEPDLGSAPLNAVEAEQPARGLIVKLEDSADVEVADLVDEVSEELPDGVAVADAQSGAELGLLSLSEQVDAEDLDAAIEELESNPDVSWVVPNGVRMPSATANDTHYGQLWNLHGTWGVEANRAWDTTLGASSVRVAVIDTGLLTGHPDLRGRYVAGRDFVDDEYRCLNRACTKIRYRKTFESANDGNGWDASPADPGDWRSDATCDWMGRTNSSWHGTHVAGIIAATRNNSEGVVGIAPGVKVQPIRALGRCGGTDWDIAMSILWASGANVNAYDRRHGKIPVNRQPSKVINLSLGARARTLTEARQACRLYASVAKAARSRGSIVVAAAGNDGLDHRYNVPSSCAGFVSVAATTREGARAAYSNYGAGIDLAAPGGSGSQVNPQENILSTWNSGTRSPGAQGYGFMPGTSMAAPAVSAVAALGHSVGIRHPDVLERVMKATARRSSCGASSCGAGIVSAYGVVTAKAPTSAPRISGAARPGHTLRATPGSWRNGATVRLTWYRGSKAVRTGTTYRLTKADLGQRVAVRATATNGHPSIYHQSTVVVKSKPRLAFAVPSKFKKSKRVKLTAKIKAPHVRATGTIRVYDGSKRIAVKKMYAKNKGKVTITLPKIKRKGKHRIRVIYSGSAKVSSAKKSKVVRVR